MRLIYRYLCLAFGALLGTGCDRGTFEPDYGSPQPEYGVPTGTVVVSGQVQDAEGQGLEGIEVQLTYTARDTTDVLGRFSIARQGIFLPCLAGNEICQVQAHDIDGAANGSYADGSADLELQQTEPGQGSWDLGTFEDTDVTIVLDPAREAESERP